MVTLRINENGILVGRVVIVYRYQYRRIDVLTTYRPCGTRMYVQSDRNPRGWSHRRQSSRKRAVVQYRRKRRLGTIWYIPGTVHSTVQRQSMLFSLSLPNIHVSASGHGTGLTRGKRTICSPRKSFMRIKSALKPHYNERLGVLRSTYFGIANLSSEIMQRSQFEISRSKTQRVYKRVSSILTKNVLTFRKPHQQCV
jgi:hypothetical protein